MKESYWGYWIMLLGILIVGVMLLVNRTTSGNTQDYYLLKEVTQASMIDAVDLSYYRLYGDIKMSEQKFVENFIRRFSENVTLSTTYDVAFYDIYEIPPKVSVKVTSNSGNYNIAESQNDFDIVDKIDAILLLGNSNVGDAASDKRMCSLDWQNELFQYMLNLGKNNQLESTYPYMYNDWYKDTETRKDYKAFTKAFNEQFPDLKTLKYDDLIAKYPEIKTWLDSGWVTVAS